MIHLIDANLCRCHTSPVKIVRVLGEGGFSFVYLAQDEHSGVRKSWAEQHYIQNAYLKCFYSDNLH